MIGKGRNQFDCCQAQLKQANLKDAYLFSSHLILQINSFLKPYKSLSLQTEHWCRIWPCSIVVLGGFHWRELSLSMSFFSCYHLSWWFLILWLYYDYKTSLILSPYAIPPPNKELFLAIKRKCKLIKQENKHHQPSGAWQEAQWVDVCLSFFIQFIKKGKSWNISIYIFKLR